MTGQKMPAGRLNNCGTLWKYRGLSGDSDHALALIKKGDEAGFGLFFDRYAGMLFHLLLPE